MKEKSAIPVLKKLKVFLLRFFQNAFAENFNIIFRAIISNLDTHFCFLVKSICFPERAHLNIGFV